MSQAFNELELLDRVDNDTEFLAETVQMLSDDGPALMRGIRKSLAAGDADGVARAAHALKGMVSNFSSAAVPGCAADLEKLARTGGLSDAVAAVEALDTTLRELIDALKDFVAARA
jgi:two-component system, sensor histidine kinase and response regulator